MNLRKVERVGNVPSCSLLRWPWHDDEIECTTIRKAGAVGTKKVVELREHEAGDVTRTSVVDGLR